MADTAARMLALLGLLQARVRLVGGGARAAARGHRPDRAQRHRPAAGSRLPRGRRPWSGRPLPARRRHQAAAAAARGRRGGRRRGRAARRDWPSQGIEETSARALAKLEHVLPHRLRRRVNALRDAVSAGPENTGSNVEDPRRRPGAARRGRRRRPTTTWSCASTTGARTTPARALPAGQLAATLVRGLAGTPRTDTWAPYRLDWMQLRTPGGRRVHAATTARRGLHGVRAPRGRVLGLGSAHAHRRGRPGRRRCSPGSTPPWASSRASTTTTASWSPAVTASR